ncbi:hypothetical protein L0F63_006986 [Massospora cicadina]|nr:hypothetical protein L0F63_006986 [Massospora cicadina]
MLAKSTKAFHLDLNHLNPNCQRLVHPDPPARSSRFLVKQSTIASGHFHFYPKDKRILETPLLGNGKTKQCLRFSPFGECLDFCLQTDNGVNLAWIQFLPNPSPRFRVDLNRSGRMAWVCSSLRVESDLPWPGLPRLCLSDASQERRFRWVANHPQVYDGLALVDLTIPNSVLGIYFLPSNSVREGYLDFFPDEAPTPITSEDLIFHLPQIEHIAHAKHPTHTHKFPLIHIKSDLLFEKVHLW